LQTAKKRKKKDEGKEFTMKKLSNMDKEEKKPPSAKDKKCDESIVVSYSFPGIKLFMEWFHNYFYECNCCFNYLGREEDIDWGKCPHVPPMPEERQRKGGLVSVMQEKTILCAMHRTMVRQVISI
jgi:hypothetical protein